MKQSTEETWEFTKGKTKEGYEATASGLKYVGDSIADGASAGASMASNKLEEVGVTSTVRAGYGYVADKTS